MSVIIFFSASKTIFFGRNDVQAIDFLRKGGYAPGCLHMYKSNKSNKSECNSIYKF
jgi:hypothetical protein